MSTFDELLDVATIANYESYRKVRAAYGAPMPPWADVSPEAQDMYRNDTRAGLVAIDLPEILASRERAIDLAVTLEGELHDMGWQT